MAWTYDATLLSISTSVGRRYSVRLIIGDTDTTDQQLQDEEIDFFLSQGGDSIRSASIMSVRALLAKYARIVDLQVGHTQVEAAQRARAYRSLLETLESATEDFVAQIFAGGQSKDEKETLEDDTDAVQPAFKIGQHDIDSRFNYPTESVD